MYEVASLIVEATPEGQKIIFSNATRNQELTTIVPHKYRHILAHYCLKGWEVRHVVQISATTTSVLMQRKLQNRSGIDPKIKELGEFLDQLKPMEIE